MTMELVFETHSTTEDNERGEGIVEWRWWSHAELRRCPDPLWPPRLPVLLEQLRDHGPPPSPVDVTS